MGCQASSEIPSPAATGGGQKDRGDNSWSQDTADKLQESVDLVFGTAGKNLLGLEFSFSIADPALKDCALIGCSTGFTKLCGYTVEEIVGRNCRFLIDPVPPDQVDAKMRKHTKQFCENVREGLDYWVPRDEWESWMPEQRPGDELFCMQRNIRKDGSPFNNMFLMKAVEFSSKLGRERPYIVALQSELPDGKEDLKKLSQNIGELEANMRKVTSRLSSLFFVRTALGRQGPESSDDDFLDDLSDVEADVDAEGKAQITPRHPAALTASGAFFSTQGL